MLEFKMIKYAVYGLIVLAAGGAFIYLKIKAGQANAMLEKGDYQGALSAYRKLFLMEVEAHIEEDGSGNVKDFLKSLKNNGRAHLEQIGTILEQKGILLDRGPYDKLVEDVEQFAQQTGVMNYKKEPVQEGKVQFARFHKQLHTFTQTIPEQL